MILLPPEEAESSLSSELLLLSGDGDEAFLFLGEERRCRLFLSFELSLFFFFLATFLLLTLLSFLALWLAFFLLSTTEGTLSSLELSSSLLLLLLLNGTLDFFARRAIITSLLEMISELL
jgi:hypothetical protein